MLDAPPQTADPNHAPASRSAYATIARHAAGAAPLSVAAACELARAYQALGLSVAALDVLHAHADQPEASRLAQSVRDGLHESVVPTCELQGNFERNLRVALSRFPHWTPHESALRSATQRLEIHRCLDGNRQLARRIGDGPRRWLPHVGDWRREADAAALLPPSGAAFCKPYAIQGVGFGELLDRVLSATGSMFLGYSPRVHVIEPNLAQLAVWLHLRDQENVLSQDRVLIWAGPDAVEQFIAHCATHPELQHPAQLTRWPVWGPDCSAAVDASLRALHQHEQQAALALLAQIDEQVHAAPSRVRSFRTTPLRILGITSRFTTFLQYSMRDLADALRAKGHEFALHIEPDAHTYGLLPLAFLKHVRDCRPDLLLMIDHNRSEFGRWAGSQIPFCNWVQDELPHLFMPGAGAGLRRDDFVVGLMSQQLARAAGYPPAQVRYLPMPVNTRLYRAEPMDDATLAPLRCDVSFVSHLSLPAERFVVELKSHYPQASARRLIEALYESLGPRIAGGWAPSTPQQTEAVILALAAELKLPMDDAGARRLRREFVDRLVSTFFRHQPLLWAAQAGLHLRIYGRGWEHHPQLGRFACGVAENGEHLRAIYQATRINLQLFPGSALHQRLLEGLCSGGFFLIRGLPCDEVVDLYASVARRVVHADIRDEAALLGSADAQLSADARRLLDVLVAPGSAYAGFVEHLRDYATWARELDMPSVLPRFAEVRFTRRDEFESQARRYLSAAESREAVAVLQRSFVRDRHSYDRFADDMLAFIAERFNS